MKIEKTGDSSPLGTLQGPSKGPQIAKTAENPKNHDFFYCFFSSEAKENVCCQDTIKWFEGTGKEVRAPRGPVLGALLAQESKID